MDMPRTPSGRSSIDMPRTNARASLDMSRSRNTSFNSYFNSAAPADPNGRPLDKVSSFESWRQGDSGSEGA